MTTQVMENSTLKEHQRLTQLISEEATLLENTKIPDEAGRLTLILEFLTELQIIKAKELLRGGKS